MVALAQEDVAPMCQRPEPSFVDLQSYFEGDCEHSIESELDVERKVDDGLFGGQIK